MGAETKPWCIVRDLCQSTVRTTTTSNGKITFTETVSEQAATVLVIVIADIITHTYIGSCAPSTRMLLGLESMIQGYVTVFNVFKLTLPGILSLSHMSCQTMRICDWNKLSGLTPQTRAGIRLCNLRPTWGPGLFGAHSGLQDMPGIWLKLDCQLTSNFHINSNTRWGLYDEKQAN